MENELLQYLPAFMKALEEQLDDDFYRWGNTWQKRTQDGQEKRIESTLTNYFDQFNNGGVPMPWLKVVGNAYIAWVRETYGD